MRSGAISRRWPTDNPDINCCIFAESSSTKATGNGMATDKRIVFFDLGKTLEHNDVLLPGATQLLDAVSTMKDPNCEAPAMGLISDYFSESTEAGVQRRLNEYYDILDNLGILARFDPVAKDVTLSTEVGVFKPDEKIFRVAMDRIAPNQPFSSAYFITENLPHVTACRDLGMIATHFRGPGQATGEIADLNEAIPIIKKFVEATMPADGGTSG